MKTLVLCVDRDDDFGVKCGINTPIIGREDAVNAALALGLRDPEDSDVNTLLAALGMYDDMVKKGIDAEIALICGDMKVGYESDLALTTQLENTLEVIKPDRVVLVSDGAEDEYIYPMISSRSKIDSVRRVFVKQAPTVEGTYYILMKMLQDDKMRKRILTPIGLVLFVFGLFSLVPKFVQLAEKWDITIVSQMAGGTISLVLGLYLIFYEALKGLSKRTSAAVRSGSQMIPFAILATVLFLTGLAFGLDSANADPEADVMLKSLLFSSGVLWMWVFAFFSYETGRFINYFLSKGKVNFVYLVSSITLFAIAFITQGALDATEYALGYENYSETVIFLEILSGFLLALFGGILNTSFRSLTDAPEEVANEA